MAWELIDSLDAPSSGVFDFPSLDLTGYEVIQIVCSGITVTTDGTDPGLTFYVSGSEVTSGYRWGVASMSTSGTSNADGDTSDPKILLVANDANFDVGNATAESFGAVVTVDDPLSTTSYKKAYVDSAGIGPTGNAIGTTGVGIMENAGAITGLKISGSSNLTAGKVRVLGLA